MVGRPFLAFVTLFKPREGLADGDGVEGNKRGPHAFVLLKVVDPYVGCQATSTGRLSVTHAIPSRGLKRVKRMLEMDDQPLSPMSGSARAVSQFLSATPPLQTGDNTRLRVSLCQSVSVLVSYFRSVV